MKLYEVPHKSFIKLIGRHEDETFFFDHLDGAYSYCTDADGNVIHLSASTNVTTVETLQGEA